MELGYLIPVFGALVFSSIVSAAFIYLIAYGGHPEDQLDADEYLHERDVHGMHKT